MNEIWNVLVQQFLWDISVMSQPWMYFCLLVPITFFVIFFILKWLLLTLPFWVIPVTIVGAFRKKKCYTKK